MTSDHTFHFDADDDDKDDTQDREHSSDNDGRNWQLKHCKYV